MIVNKGKREFKMDATELSIPVIAYAYINAGKKEPNKAVIKIYFQ